MWSTDEHGELGIGIEGATAVPKPQLVNGTWLDIALGQEFTCAINANGSAYASVRYVDLPLTLCAAALV